MKTFRHEVRRTRSSRAALLGIALILAVSAAANAQVVSDPRVAEFDPSPDHWQTLESGEPAVARYELGVYLIGASAPFATVDMGKPDPEADGKIRYDFSSGVSGWPLTGSYYEARVSAVGPEGAGLSEASNQFVFGAPSACMLSLSATSPQVPAAGGDYAVDVFTGDGCAWGASTALSWVTLLTSSGSGNGMVAFVLNANTTISSRTGTITIGG
ncbi:MAG: BACON domain-containing protein [Vicinamibacterales bacterium]